MTKMVWSQGGHTKWRLLYYRHFLDQIVCFAKKSTLIQRYGNVLFFDATMSSLMPIAAQTI